MLKCLVFCLWNVVHAVFLFLPVECFFFFVVYDDHSCFVYASDVVFRRKDLVIVSHLCDDLCGLGVYAFFLISCAALFYIAEDGGNNHMSRHFTITQSHTIHFAFSLLSLIRLMVIGNKLYWLYLSLQWWCNVSFQWSLVKWRILLHMHMHQPFWSHLSVLLAS